MLWADIRANRQEIGKVLGGVVDYYRRGDVALDARSALLKLHCSTNGRMTDRLATVLRALRPARRPTPVSGLLGDLSVDAQDSIANQIARDGYYVFEQRLPESLCDEIQQFAEETPCTVENRGREPKDRMLFDPAAPVSKTYRVTEEDIIRSRAMQRLMSDPAVLAVAERYLRTLPVLSMVNLWWSATFGNEPGADAAQEFHFDFDPPPRWLLFFVYLTDVGPNNGPHVYAKGTHLAGIPAAGPLLARGYVRIPDKDIEAAFGKESIVELYGKRGTVLAVDTRGFHKGKMLTAGHRLMGQLTFSSPAYSGAHARKMKLPSEIEPALARAIKTSPRVYEKYT
jgi:phytanoyl-CoA dioxygenase PhyH